MRGRTKRAAAKEEGQAAKEAATEAAMRAKEEVAAKTAAAKAATKERSDQTDEGGRTMKRLIWGMLGAAVAYAAVQNMSDVKRYLKIRSM